MAGRLKYQNTYLPYPGGIDPKLLRVGTLVLDIYNPTEGIETERFEFQERYIPTPFQPPTTNQPSLPQEDYEKLISTLPGFACRSSGPNSLSFSASKEWGLSAGLIELVNGGVTSTGEMHVTIEGPSFRRIEMSKPQAFLEKTVLHQDGIAEWIRNKATAGFYARLFNSTEGLKTPKIWVCTGVQLIKGAKVKSGASTGGGVEAGAKLDAGLLATGVPTGQAAFQAEAHANREHAAEMEMVDEDERVWAAKFFSLRIKYSDADKHTPQVGKDMLSEGRLLRVQLHAVEDLGGGGVRDDVKELNPADARHIAPTVAEVDGLDLPNGLEEDGEETDDLIIGEDVYREATSDVAWDKFRDYSSYVDLIDEDVPV